MPRGIYQRTKEYREQISSKMRQVWQNSKYRKHMSEAHRGENNHNWGKPRSQETKRKMSETRLQRKKTLGYLNSAEARIKMSKAKKGRPSLRKGAKLSKESLKKIACALGQRPTGLEKKFLEIIDKHNLPYKYVGDWSFKIGRCNPDFININSKKIAIEVYTKYHKLRRHATIEQWKEKRIETFKEYGWNVIFFDETQVNENYVLKTIEKTA